MEKKEEGLVTRGKLGPDRMFIQEQSTEELERYNLPGKPRACNIRCNFSLGRSLK